MQPPYLNLYSRSRIILCLMICYDALRWALHSRSVNCIPTNSDGNIIWTINAITKLIERRNTIYYTITIEGEQL